jgi:uncharacterized protein
VDSEISTEIGTARERGLVGFIRRYPLGAFLLWFFTVGQVFAFVPVVGVATGREVFAQPVVAQSFICASTLLGLLLPALVITRVVDGPEGVRRLWQRSVALRVPLRWYALALVGVPALAIALAIGLLGPPPGGVSGASVLVFGLVLQTVLTFLPNNWWEEVAWMGFFQSRLQDRHHSALRAALLTAPLFALGHVSLAVAAGGIGAVMLLVLVVLVIPFRMLTGWAYNRTGSLFLVGLVHAVGNGVAGGSGFAPGFLPRLYPDDPLVIGFIHLLAFAVIGLVALAVTRGRLGLERDRSLPPPAEPAAQPGERAGEGPRDPRS